MLSRQVSDDAEEYIGGVVSRDSDDLEMVYDAATQPPRPCNQTVGLRFNGLEIPRRAVIRSAWLQFTAAEFGTNSADLTLWGVASDNAGPWLSETFNVSSRLRTGASVGWNPPAWPAANATTSAERSPELKAIVQEIVNRSGWLPGHALAFVVTGTGVRNAWSRDGNLGWAPILNVDWVSPLAAAADTDGDGMADDWEVGAHLIGGIAALPGSDDDHDGANNGDEYIAGTDPRDPLDYPNVSLTNSGGKLVVIYPTRVATGSAYDGVDRFYAVERTTGSPGGRWVPGYGASAVPGNGALQAYTNDLVSSNGFFRVKVWLQ